MTRREAARLLILYGLGGTTVITGCGGGINEDENVLGNTPKIEVKVCLNQTTETTVKIPRGSTVLTAIRRRPFYYHQSDDGTTIINGIRGPWRYAINGIEPRVYAGDYRLTTNCRLDLRLI